jgi:hypothetical protein
MNVTDIYRISYQTAAEYIFFWAAHGNFSKIDNTLGHKRSLHK